MMLKAIKSLVRSFTSELSELERFLSAENQPYRQLVFYAESSIYYNYYRDYIEYILEHSDVPMSYITSAPADAVLKREHPRIRTFFLEHMLSAAFSKLDSKALVLSAPDINRGPIKRAPDPVHHIYAFHGICSTHQGYRHGAFDYYDSLLCIGPYQIDEIRKSEQLYNLPQKELVLTGYPLLERLYREHLAFRPALRERPLCLVAPTWAPLTLESSIMHSCIHELVSGLAKSDWDVWLRPHPEFMKRHPQQMDKIRSAVAQTKNIIVQEELSSMQCLHEADALITDHSSIAFDYALATERPVLWIDTPVRVDNPNWTKLSIEPIENQYRSRLGLRLEPSQLESVGSALNKLRAMRDEFKARVPDLRDQIISNWLRAAEIGGRHILSKVT